MKKYLLIVNSNMNRGLDAEAFNSREDAKKAMRKEYYGYIKAWEEDGGIVEYDMCWLEDASAQAENVYTDRVEWVIKVMEF